YDSSRGFSYSSPSSPISVSASRNRCTSSTAARRNSPTSTVPATRWYPLALSSSGGSCGIANPPRVPQVPHARAEIHRAHLHHVDSLDSGDRLDLRHGVERLHLAHHQDLFLAAGEVAVVEAVGGGADDGVGGAADATRREAAASDSVCGCGGSIDRGEHNALGTKIEGLLGPGGGGLRKAEHGGGARGG
ncbi:hypothetical protein MUK42_08201, partial [Musa troglodytarum]